MAETWVTITEKKVRTRFGLPEFNVVANGAVHSGAEKPVEQSIRAAVESVRGYVRSCPTNTLGPDGTVPPELEGDTLLLVLEDLSTRLPTGGMLIDENRARSIREAHRKLDKVMSCDFRITPPEVTGVTSPIADAGGWGGEIPINFNPYSTRQITVTTDS